MEGHSPKTQVRKITAVTTSAESSNFLLRSDANELWCERQYISYCFRGISERS